MNREDEKFCTACGQELVEQERAENRFCDKCGKRKYTLYRICPERKKPWWSSWDRFKAMMDSDRHTENTVRYYSK